MSIVFIETRPMRHASCNNQNASPHAVQGPPADNVMTSSESESPHASSIMSPFADSDCGINQATFQLALISFRLPTFIHLLSTLFGEGNGEVVERADPRTGLLHWSVLEYLHARLLSIKFLYSTTYPLYAPHHISLKQLVIVH
jgi:hypothetical protein